MPDSIDSELDDLERELLRAADIWFNQDLHEKLHRLIALARALAAAKAGNDNPAPSERQKELV